MIWIEGGKESRRTTRAADVQEGKKDPRECGLWPASESKSNSFWHTPPPPSPRRLGLIILLCYFPPPLSDSFSVSLNHTVCSGQRWGGGGGVVVV